MVLRVASGPELVEAVAEALDGGGPVAVVGPGGPPASFRVEEPFADSDLAVLIGTSGSTGDAKGVLLSRRAIRWSAEATHRRLGGPGSWVCPLPVDNVAGLMTIARAHVAQAAVSIVPADLSELPLLPGRNYISLVAAQLHRALDDDALIAALAPFDAVLVGGSAIPPELLSRGRDVGLPLVATYGMSETCGGCVYDGVPLDGVGIELAGDGRITLSGPMAFSGYRGDPDGTAATLDGNRVQTNDRGRVVAGRLQVLGRLDDVIISGGSNVDLAAVQRLCDGAFGPASDGGVVVLAVPDQRWGQRVVGLTTGSVDVDQVHRQLAGRLSAAAMPRQIRRVQRLPLTQTGKIDRRALVRIWRRESGGHTESMD